MQRKLLLVVIAFSILPLTRAQADLAVPKTYVADYANVVSADYERSLNGILQELEQKTGAQYIVLTVLTTSGVPIEDFAIGLAEKWQLGQKGKDNGMLFVLAATDRKYRFEIGYGLEGFITDQFAGRVGRNVLVTHLKKGDFSRGIYHANLHIAQKIAAENGIQLTGMPKLPPIRRSRPCATNLFPLLFLLFFLGRGRGMMFWGLPFLMMGGGGFGGGRSYGGGSFGGGFGSFGGGGGGGFGGGGAGGSW